MARDCSSCGRANADDARFCSGCGVEIAAAAPGVEPPPQSSSAVPPPPTPPSLSAGGAGGPPRKVPGTALLIVLIVLLVAAVAAAAVFLVLRPSSSHLGADTSTPTPTPVASVSTSASPTPAESFYLAAATGPKANALSTVEPDDTVRVITRNVGKQVFQVAWSPNGQSVACVAGTWAHRTLWIADLAAGEVAPEQIATPAVVSVDSVAWLNPRQLLVAGFTTTPKYQGDVAELLVYDAAMHEVVEPLKDASGLSLRGISVSASRDGETVAFVTYTDQKVDQYGMASATEKLELLDRFGGQLTELGSNKALFDVNARSFDEPLIAPTGDAIIFRSAGSDVGTSYTVLDAAGTTLMPAKRLLYPAGYAWDPTGQKVVFTGHSTNWKGGSGDPTIFYMFDRSTGGPPREITRYKKTAVQGLSWSPDGSKIAFSEWEPENYSTGNIYELSPLGGDASLLVRQALFPAYQPAP